MYLLISMKIDLTDSYSIDLQIASTSILALFEIQFLIAILLSHGTKQQQSNPH